VAPSGRIKKNIFRRTDPGQCLLGFKATKYLSVTALSTQETQGNLCVLMSC